MSTKITVCDTCRCANSDSDSEPRDGATLAALLEKGAQDHPNLIVARRSCLMGCDFACNIAIQSGAKLTYVLGNFEPNAHDAAGIVDYALLYDQSDTGQVPYRQWPAAVKGHFRARIPPLETDG